MGCATPTRPEVAPAAVVAAEVVAEVWAGELTKRCAEWVQERRTEGEGAGEEQQGGRGAGAGEEEEQHGGEWEEISSAMWLGSWR